MGSRLTVEIDIEPAEYNLTDIAVMTAGKGFVVRSASLTDMNKGEEVAWEVGKVWYDISLRDNNGNYPYTLKGLYCGTKRRIKVSDIMRGKGPVDS